jgi:methenyltetrahydrofolate cyclohydrolase
MDELTSIPFGQLLESIAAKTPTPGGGGVAAMTGATAAALAHMVVSYSLGRKSLAQHQGELERSSGYLGRAKEIFLELAREDAEAYGLVNELQKLPEPDPRRQRELPGANEAAIQVPLTAIAAADDLLRHCESLAAISNPHLHSDLAIAAVLAESAARSAAWMVRVNSASLHDHDKRVRLMEQARRMVEDCQRRREAVDRACTA